jgi:hypothetical protein
MIDVVVRAEDEIQPLQLCRANERRVGSGHVPRIIRQVQIEPEGAPMPFEHEAELTEPPDGHGARRNDGCAYLGGNVSHKTVS